MPPEDAAQLIAHYVEEVLNQGNLELLNEICAPDYKRHLSPVTEPLSLNEQRERLAAIRTAFPDWELKLEEIICEGDIIAFRATVRGTQKGVFLGLPATGKSVKASALDIIRIRDRKFIEHWGGPDLFTLTQQLGATLARG